MLAWQFSWSEDPCEKYHSAVLVDAFWEVSPLMVRARCIRPQFFCINLLYIHSFNSNGICRITCLYMCMSFIYMLVLNILVKIDLYYIIYTFYLVHLPKTVFTFSLQAVSSLIARTIVKPMEILTSGISKSTRNLFSEIPAQWQPIFFLVFVLITVIAVMGYFGYKISIPFVLSIEPARPQQERSYTSQGKNPTGKKYQ